MDDLAEKIREMVQFISELMHGYQNHKEQDLFNKIGPACRVADFETKKCFNPKLDPFRGEQHLRVEIEEQWNSDTSFYQAYYPIKQNIHLQQTMDWMHLARPRGFGKVPEPMKFNHQDRYYPRDYDDEKHTKLRLLINFGHERFGYDLDYLNLISQLLEMPEKRVMNYYCKTLKDNHEKHTYEQTGQPKLAKKLAEKRLEKYKQMIGPEVTQFATLEDMIQIGKTPVSNRSFHITQYFCIPCEIFFCPDHVNCDYSEVFYFQFDETEFSEFKSNVYQMKKKTTSELEKMMKTDTVANSVQSYVDCIKEKNNCWKMANSVQYEEIVGKIKVEGEKLQRIKNFLRICINSGTSNSCFLEHTIKELKCYEVGALISKIYKEEFKTNNEVAASRSLVQKKNAMDRRKVIALKLDIDKSQYQNFFGEDFTFPKHYHNLLLQKNRIVIGNSGICPGLGLFAGQRFKKDQLICIYFGEILDEEDTSGVRAKINTLYGTSYVFSLSDGKQFSIDSLVFGNKSRFVNHNELNFNNCVIELAEMNRMEYIVFKAKKDIEFGDELFFDYGDSYTLNWKYVYKHLTSYMNKVLEKKKSSSKITAGMKNRFKSGI